MSQLREPAFDRVVAIVLRTGAFGCFFVMLAGLIVGWFVRGSIPLGIERAGVLLMLATPVVRVIVACFLFFREKDWPYRKILRACSRLLNPPAKDPAAEKGSPPS